MFKRIVRSKTNEELSEVLNNTQKFELLFVLQAFIEGDRRNLENANIQKYLEYLKTKRQSDLEEILEFLDEAKDSPFYLPTQESIRKVKESSKKQPARISRLKYAGFGSRFFANLIDILIIIPIALLAFWMSSKSIILAIFSQIILALLYSIYSIYFHGHYGATIGKMMVSIKVVNLDLKNIVWKQAILRSSVDLFFGFASAILVTIAIIKMPNELLLESGILEISENIDFYKPDIFLFVDFFATAWFISEVIVLLFNEKKRALHDFIANTVVIHS